MTLNVTYKPLTNGAYSTRRIPAKVLICIHITGNSQNVGPDAATNERNYANRAGSDGPSAHDYINRDGSYIEAIGPIRFFAWSNGDVRDPNTTLPLVKAVLALTAKGYNANEAYYREVEAVGYPGTYPVTNAQKETIAQLIARDSIKTGLPISRATVGTHADINSETRPNCAFRPQTREAELAAIIARANAVKAELLGVPAVIEETNDMDPKRDLPVALCDVAGGGTVYADRDRKLPALIPTWVGAKGVGIYAVPATTPAPGTLVPVRIDLIGSSGDDLRIGWVGWDKVTNVRGLNEDLLKAQVTAAVAQLDAARTTLAERDAVISQVHELTGP